MPHGVVPPVSWADAITDKGVACTSCHGGIDKHLGDVKTRPATRMEPAACGACHQRQYETLYTTTGDANVCVPDDTPEKDVIDSWQRYENIVRSLDTKPANGCYSNGVLVSSSCKVLLFGL